MRREECESAAAQAATAMSDLEFREATLRRIAVASGPPWWRPFARRRWRRVVACSPGAAHWTVTQADDEMARYVRLLADRYARDLSDDLPGWLDVRYGEGDA